MSNPSSGTDIGYREVSMISDLDRSAHLLESTWPTKALGSLTHHAATGLSRRHIFGSVILASVAALSLRMVGFSATVAQASSCNTCCSGCGSGCSVCTSSSFCCKSPNGQWIVQGGGLCCNSSNCSFVNEQWCVEVCDDGSTSSYCASSCNGPLSNC